MKTIPPINTRVLWSTFSIEHPNTILWVVTKFQRLVALFIFALFLDTISTMHFMIQGGIDLELHPLVRMGADIYGPILGTFLTAFIFKILGGLLVAAYMGPWAPYFLTITTILSALAGVYNFFGHMLF